MPDILNAVNVRQDEKQVPTRRRLFQLSHVLDQSSNTDLLPKCRYSTLRFPLFDAAKTTTLLKSQLESSVPRNGCPAKGDPLFQWSWQRNGRKPGWKRPLVRLPPLSVTTEKTESVNIGCSQSFLESDLKAVSLRPELPQDTPPNVHSEETSLKIKPESSNKLKEQDTADREVKNDLPKIKRRQLVVVIPYIQYDSNVDESEDSVDEYNDAFNNNNINEKYQKRSLKYSCRKKRGMAKRLVQDRDNSSGKTICNKQSENLRLSSKSNVATESRKSAQRMRVLMRKTIAATEARGEQCCFGSEGDSADNEDESKEKLIVDFSHKVRVQWQKELRQILNKSPDYKRGRDAARANEKLDLRSCKMAAVLPPAASKDNFFSLQNNRRKCYDKLTKSVNQNDQHLQRLGAGYNSALTRQVSLGQKTSKFGRRKQNPTSPSEVRTTKSTRKPRNLCGHCDSSPSDSFDFNFFWNLLEASKSQAGAGVKHSPNDSRKNSYSSSSEFLAINSPVHKKVFLYKKKQINK